MEKSNSVKITGIIVGAVLLVALIISWTLMDLSPINKETINVQGQAEVSILPDLVTVNFNIQTNGSTAKDAKNENARVVDDIIVALIKAGFDRDEITTSNFNVYEDYEWKREGRELKGYKATHNLKIQMSTDYSEKIGEAIDAGIDNGAMLSYINFELSSEMENQYESQATLIATQNAKMKAEAMAEGLNMKLGKVVSVSDVNLGYSPYRAYSMDKDSGAGGIEMAKNAVTSIQPGEQKVYGNVNVVYRLR